MKSSLTHMKPYLIQGGGPEDDGAAYRVTRVKAVGELCIIASWSAGWDHVSVSLINRAPIWSEMCWVKGRFFDEDEWVVQYHPARSAYINNHPYCLHLWRPQNEPLPTPLPEMV